MMPEWQSDDTHYVFLILYSYEIQKQFSMIGHA